MKIEYPLTTADFLEKAEKIIDLADKMTETFSANNSVEFHREHLKIAIAAGCLDSHYNGFKNGQYKSE